MTINVRKLPLLGKLSRGGSLSEDWNPHVGEDASDALRGVTFNGALSELPARKALSLVLACAGSVTGLPSEIPIRTLCTAAQENGLVPLTKPMVYLAHYAHFDIPDDVEFCIPTEEGVTFSLSTPVGLKCLALWGEAKVSAAQLAIFVRP